MELKTDLKVLESSLKRINTKEMPLEEALYKSSEILNVEILDNIKIIRDFLTEKKLLVHNPRLAVLNVERQIANGVKSIQDEVHEEFINDFVTDKCSELIVSNQLLVKLKEIK